MLQRSKKPEGGLGQLVILYKTNNYRNPTRRYDSGRGMNAGLHRVKKEDIWPSSAISRLGNYCGLNMTSLTLPNNNTRVRE